MKETLTSWDGKSVAALKALYARGFDLSEALALCGEDTVARGASWLVKHHTECARLAGAEAQAVLDALRPAEDWQVVLHLVQALDRVDLEGCDMAAAVEVLRWACRHDAPFVRAWALSAFARVGAVQPDYSDAARGLVMEALMADEKPSVMARLRKAAGYLE